MGSQSVQVLALCGAVRLVRCPHMAVEVRKIKANVSHVKTSSWKRMREKEKSLEARTERLLAQE